MWREQDAIEPLASPMDKDYLILKRASASRLSGEWSDDDYDEFADGAVVGRIFKVHAAPVGTPWMWTLTFGYHEDRTPTHGPRSNARGCYDSIRQELAAGVTFGNRCRSRTCARGIRRSPAAHLRRAQS
jgi:hypothetical protein